MREKSKQETALEEIAKIRRNGFNPSDELVEFAISHHGPERALVIMRLAAHVDRAMIEPVH
jgi:hypothetical protein